MHRVALLVLTPLLLVACGASTNPLPPDPAPEEPRAPEASTLKPQYTEYSPRGMDTRRGAILFFMKQEDIFSKRNDALLKTLYESGSVSVSTYRVNFDTATGARLQYGVVVADTFILLDASGERVGAYTHPTSAEVRVLVQGRVPVPPSK